MGPVPKLIASLKPSISFGTGRKPLRLKTRISTK
jgi:hypothetical protein